MATPGKEEGAIDVTLEGKNGYTCTYTTLLYDRNERYVIFFTDFRSLLLRFCHA